MIDAFQGARRPGKDERVAAVASANPAIKRYFFMT
jgi:hypothetical protein